ncbi:MAG: hypothetical protein E7592_06500 [Ruminococcaceae bacterium]|nr:hypothetical protein [Oscillospiraceae bacterium]
MNKKNNKGCASGILGTLCVILGVVAYAIVSSLLNRLFIGIKFGSDIACALLPMTLTGISIAFVLYEVIFVVWQVKLSQISSQKGDGNNKISKIFKFVTIGCISASLLFAIFSANTYTELREDSISKVCFVTTKEYKWNEKNDVMRYSFACDEEGGLTFKITMKDGEVINLLGSVSSLSDSFKEKFNTDKVSLLSYAAHLSEQFDNSGFIIEKNVSEASIKNAESFYKEKYPEIWKQIEIIISD